jgi:2,3-bisphosphoglycerate-dependent phosphoglycerate mutase
MEPVAHLVLIRHEESCANAALNNPADELYYRVSGSDISVDLTDHGELRSVELGKQLAERFDQSNPITVAISSRYKRAIRTKENIIAALPYSVSCSTDERLNKRSYGKFWNLTYTGVASLHPLEFERYRREGSFFYRPPDGENYPDLFQRSDQFFDSTLVNTSENLLVVSHLVVLLALMRRLEALPDSDVMQMYDNSALPNGTVLVYEKDSAGRWKRT